MKEYRCNKIEKNLVIDGNLEKPEWKNAVKVQLVNNVTGEKARQGTALMLLYNRDFLYAGFQCEDDYLNSTMTQYNDNLYEEDVVELFIDDNSDQKTYIELEVNPLNALLHYCIHHSLNRRFLKFARVEKTVNSAVRYDGKNKILSVEIEIPFSEFVTAVNNPPESGDKWLFNAYRIDRGKNGDDEYTAWSPTKELYFHKPQYFGELIFE